MTPQHASGPAAGFSSAWDQKTTKNYHTWERTVSGTENNRRFFKETKSEHPVVRGTTLFDQGTLTQKKGKESIQFNASLETVSMIGKLIESVNRLCILPAIMKYVDDFLEKTTIEAQERNTGEVKLHPPFTRKLHSSRSNQPSRGRKPLARKRRKREEGSSTQSARTASGRLYVLSQIEN